MPRNYKRKIGSKVIINYSDETIQKAVNELIENNLTFRQASKKYNIPLGTLYNRVHDKHGVKKHGGQTVLTSEEERNLVENVIICSDWGFPLDRDDVKMYVKMFLDEQGRVECRFHDNTPGNDWMASFLKRHKEALSVRLANNIKRARANVDVEMLSKYHDNVANTLKDIPPHAIFNFDETNLSDKPGGKKFLFRRGVKYPDRVINFSKSCITIMMCASADGVLLPPYVVYKALNMYPSWASGGPKGEPCCNNTCCKSGSQYHYTVSGWFDMPTFERWFINVFIPHAKMIEGPKAVICDNLSSHLSPLVLKESKKNNIAFICLPPNSTHLSQPLDVAFFAPLKRAWSLILESFKKSNPNKSIVDKTLFPTLLKQLLSHWSFMSKIPFNIRSGFRATGLCPLNKSTLLKRLLDSKSSADLSRSPQSLQASPSSSVAAQANVSSEYYESPLVNFLQKQRFAKQLPTRKRGKKYHTISPGKTIVLDTSESTDEPEPEIVVDNTSEDEQLPVSKRARTTSAKKKIVFEQEEEEEFNPNIEDYVIVEVFGKRNAQKHLAMIEEKGDWKGRSCGTHKVKFLKPLNNEKKIFYFASNDTSEIELNEMIKKKIAMPCFSTLNRRDVYVFDEALPVHFNG